MAGYYDFVEAIRKVAKATAYRALNLKDVDGGPNNTEIVRGLAVAVGEWLGCSELDVKNFVRELQDYTEYRRGANPKYRNPHEYM